VRFGNSPPTYPTSLPGTARRRTNNCWRGCSVAEVKTEVQKDTKAPVWEDEVHDFALDSTPAGRDLCFNVTVWDWESDKMVDGQKVIDGKQCIGKSTIYIERLFTIPVRDSSIRAAPYVVCLMHFKALSTTSTAHRGSPSGSGPTSWGPRRRVCAARSNWR
jgi:hypothetical protein